MTVILANVYTDWTNHLSYIDYWQKLKIDNWLFKFLYTCLPPVWFFLIQQKRPDFFLQESWILISEYLTRSLLSAWKFFVTLTYAKDSPSNGVANSDAPWCQIRCVIKWKKCPIFLAAISSSPLAIIHLNHIEQR